MKIDLELSRVLSSIYEEPFNIIFAAYNEPDYVPDSSDDCVNCEHLESCRKGDFSNPCPWSQFSDLDKYYRK